MEKVLQEHSFLQAMAVGRQRRGPGTAARRLYPAAK
jgi:hypothetical protein